MPRGDRTGPAGAGPRTGRGAGFGLPNAAPVNAAPLEEQPLLNAGRGFGAGRGRGAQQQPGFGRRCFRPGQGRGGMGRARNGL